MSDTDNLHSECIPSFILLYAVQRTLHLDTRILHTWHGKMIDMQIHDTIHSQHHLRMLQHGQYILFLFITPFPSGHLASRNSQYHSTCTIVVFQLHLHTINHNNNHSSSKCHRSMDRALLVDIVHTNQVTVVSNSCNHSFISHCVISGSLSTICCVLDVILTLLVLHCSTHIA